MLHEEAPFQPQNGSTTACFPEQKYGLDKEFLPCNHSPLGQAAAPLAGDETGWGVPTDERACGALS
jgi:hypothetical protein